MDPTFTTTPGHENAHGQVVLRGTEKQGKGTFQYIYELQCTHCGEEHKVDGNLIANALCPHCLERRYRNSPEFPIWKRVTTVRRYGRTFQEGSGIRIGETLGMCPRCNLGLATFDMVLPDTVHCPRCLRHALIQDLIPFPGLVLETDYLGRQIS